MVERASVSGGERRRSGRLYFSMMQRKENRIEAEISEGRQGESDGGPGTAQ